jgi:hypothetical protein
VRIVASHFASSTGLYTGRRAIRIVSVSRGVEDRYGNLAVRLRLRYWVTCSSGLGQVPGCRPGVKTRPDVVYLRVSSGRWRIVKPGQIYVETSGISPPPFFDAWTAPGDRATVNQVPTLPRPPSLCPTGGVGAAARHHLLAPSSANAKPIPYTAAPWLGITHVRAVWLGRSQLCVSITLAAAPRADSDYVVDVEQARNGGEEEDEYGTSLDAGATVPSLAGIKLPPTTGVTARRRCGAA